MSVRTPKAASRVTRGHGLLERQLSTLRARKANRLIPEDARNGRILDIGCGSYPKFLIDTRFAERFGIDQGSPADVENHGVQLRQHNLNTEHRLPFDDAFFDIVTMLAVLEHLDRPIVARLLPEVHRVLRYGGRLVMTTPSPWTDNLLKVMAQIGLLSSEEITEHKELRARAEITRLLVDAGFAATSIESGTFELGANVWVRARR